MSLPADTQLMGTYGKGGGSTFGLHVCPKGAVLTSLYGRASGSNIKQLCGVCSDGTSLGCYGKASDGSWSRQGAFKTIYGRSGETVDNILGAGSSSGGSYFNNVCPDKTYLNAFTGHTDGSKVTRVQFGCGIEKNEFCEYNIDDDICHDVDVQVLNKACGRNFGKLCRARRNELDEGIIASYCFSNLDDPMCSCYKSPPSYIPPEISGLANCWSQDCALSGYIPLNMRKVCPNIKICRQAVDTSGGNNILTNNVTIQDCSDKIVPGPAPEQGPGTITGPNPTPQIPGGSGGGGTVVTDNTGGDPNSESANTSNWLYLVLVFVFIIIVGIVYAMSGSSTTKQQFQQQYALQQFQQQFIPR